MSYTGSVYKKVSSYFGGFLTVNVGIYVDVVLDDDITKATFRLKKISPKTFKPGVNKTGLGFWNGFGLYWGSESYKNDRVIRGGYGNSTRLASIAENDIWYTYDRNHSGSNLGNTRFIYSIVANDKTGKQKYWPTNNNPDTSKSYSINLSGSTIDDRLASLKKAKPIGYVLRWNQYTPGNDIYCTVSYSPWSDFSLNNLELKYVPAAVKDKSEYLSCNREGGGLYVKKNNKWNKEYNSLLTDNTSSNTTFIKKNGVWVKSLLTGKE